MSKKYIFVMVSHSDLKGCVTTVKLTNINFPLIRLNYYNFGTQQTKVKVGREEISFFFQKSHQTRKLKIKVNHANQSI